MKRMILTSMLTVAGLMAQATPAQSTPQAPASKTTAPVVKKHKKTPKKPAAGTQNAAPAASKTPAAKQ